MRFAFRRSDGQPCCEPRPWRRGNADRPKLLFEYERLIAAENSSLGTAALELMHLQEVRLLVAARAAAAIMHAAYNGVFFLLLAAQEAAVHGRWAGH